MEEDKETFRQRLLMISQQVKDQESTMKKIDSLLNELLALQENGRRNAETTNKEVHCRLQRLAFQSESMNDALVDVPEVGSVITSGVHQKWREDGIFHRRGSGKTTQVCAQTRKLFVQTWKVFVQTWKVFVQTWKVHRDCADVEGSSKRRLAQMVESDKTDKDILRTEPWCQGVLNKSSGAEILRVSDHFLEFKYEPLTLALSALPT
ncbi:hypothetical protein Bbelb_110740 [Branchiostoma belcheri]|nr:hypothetical protein Bbelb_110740 [Branchiostoma belcheri]